MAKMRATAAVLAGPQSVLQPAQAARACGSVWQALGCGIALTLAQVVLACGLSGQTDLEEAYLTLFEWDGGYYGSIVQHGYSVTPSDLPGMQGAANVAFFPGYPMLVGLVQAVGRFDKIQYPLLLTSQLCCVGFWTYLLLFLQRWRIPAGLATLGVLGVILHPAAFYLVASYSESTFLMALLGFLYWSDRRWYPLAALHGFVMTATRLVGLPLVVLPLLAAWLDAGGPTTARAMLRRSFTPAVVGMVAALGSLCFFGFCQWRFGHWDAYMRIEESAWHVRPDYLAVLSPRIFHIHWPSLHDGFIDPEFVSRLSVPVTLLAFALLFWLEWRFARLVPGTQWRSRVGLYLGAGLMFYICVSGHSARGMSSMVRFTLCVDVLLVLAAVHLLRRAWPVQALREKTASLALGALACLSFAFQVALAYRFVHGKWVA
jgi:hypothetical protein